MIPLEILKKIRQIELRTNRIVTELAERGCMHLSRVVNHKIILCLALVFTGALIGCSTAARHGCDVQPPKAAAADKVKLKFVKVDSEESDGENGHGENAVDGNPDTFWHTQWQGMSPETPHEIIIELLPPSVIEGFTYLPRQDVSDHGHIKGFEFSVSDDGWSFGQPVKKGTFEPGKRRSTETFVPTKCRFIKLKAISEVNGLPWTSAAEIGVIQNGDVTQLMLADAAVAMSRPPLYLHLIASFEHPRPPRLIVSASIQLSREFDILTDNNQHLTGRVEPRNGKLFVHFQAGLCSGMNVFDGEVELEKRYEPGPQPYDAKAPFICQPHFVLSANADPKPFLRWQAAAEKEQWHLENPLSARQLATVKKQFKLMRPGMTEDQVFVLLGLSRYRSRLQPSWPSYKWGLSDYQPANGERLLLFLDDTGVGSKTLKFADGQKLEWLDYASDRSHRIVVRAELSSLAWSNSPRVWQTVSQWP